MDVDVGVPVIVPVVVSKVRPAGSAGVIDHDTTGPPVLLGAILAAALVVRVIMVLG
jgi:hypothetical protein